MKKLALFILVVVIVLVVVALLPATKALMVKEPVFYGNLRFRDAEKGTYIGYAVLTGNHPIPVSRLEIWSPPDSVHFFFNYSIPFFPTLALATGF